MKLLNVGCGSTFHTDWINIDIYSTSPSVQTHDIRKNLPYPNLSFDACYSSHVLEHLTKDSAHQLLSECFRILKSNGVVRIVVPDLESIVRNYLHTLEQVESGVVEATPNYEWMMLELYDQVVRSMSGGEMSSFLKNPKLENKDFIRSRFASEAEMIWREETVEKKSILTKIKSQKGFWFIEKLRITLAKQLVSLIAGRESRKAFEEGLFRNSGEIHRWMYDRFSLRQILEQSGFVEVKVCQADESRIPNFTQYGLDVVEDKIRKPDSLFLEGIKP
jgi:predicted SAM-dependent methyltransferase